MLGAAATRFDHITPKPTQASVRWQLSSQGAENQSRLATRRISLPSLQDHTDVVLVSCDLSLEAKRLPPPGYPTHLRTWGAHIRKIRMDRRLLQKDISRILGVSSQDINGWETNRAEPHVQNHPRIIKFLGYVPSFLLPMTFGQAIETLRSLVGMNQPNVAAYIGVHRDTIVQWELGRFIPNVKTMIKLEEFIFSQRDHNLLNTSEFVMLTRRLIQYSYLYPVQQDQAPGRVRDSWGWHIHKARIVRTLTRLQVAEHLGLREEIIEKWETRERTPLYRFWPRLVDFLGYVPWFIIPRQGASVGARLLFIRRLHGLSQVEMAQCLNVSRTTLNRWEYGRKSPAEILRHETVKELLRGGLM